jgi:predicted PhzF superfamily epimerase YddE/YHI9
MRLPLYQVDAFSPRVFAGNPAAICPLEEWLPAETMQAIAAENNLAETAFFVRNNGHFELRWFTPACEVDLCGHATLASAHVLFEVLNERGEQINFETKSGLLTVQREGELLVLNFPSRPPTAVEPHPDLLPSLGGEPMEVLAARDYLVRYATENDVLALTPNLERLAKVDRFAVIVTAPGIDVDFVSRFFAPAKGVPEDPVTGSAHCTLTPYWAMRLGKMEMRARQVSKRSGELLCRLLGDRVEMAGHAALYLRGEIEV